MIPVLCGAATLMGMNANAFQEDGCFAASVISADQNGTSVSADRSITSNALGAPDKNNEAGGFYSLGKGGSITLQLGGAVFNQPGPDLRIFETSFSGDDCGRSDDETAMVEVSEFGGLWVSLGEICRDGTVDFDGMPLAFAGQIRITDTTVNGGDGYDVDGVMAINGCIDLDDENLCFASSVVEGSFMQGLTKKDKAVPADRSDATKALGEPEYVYIRNNETFVSLGYGGSIVLGFDGVIYDEPGNDLLVVETTGTGANAGASPAWVETAEIFVSQDNVAYYSVGFANKFEAAQLDIADAVDDEGNPVVLEFIRNVKVQDVTPTSSISGDAYDLDGIVALNGCSMDPFEDPEVCNNFDYFIADKKSGENLKIYAAKAVAGNAVLTMVTEREEPVSIAYDEFTNTLYGINAAGTKIEKINPVNGASEGSIAVDPGVGSAVFSAVFKNGFLYAGSGTKNQIVKIGPDGSYDVVITGTPINGGDLAFIGDDLYFSTKDGDDLFKVIGGDATDVGSIPANVHGVSATPDGNFASVAKNSSAIQFLDTEGNVTSSLPATFNGMTFTFTDGDMTGGCNIPNNDGDDDPADCYVADFMNYVRGTKKNLVDPIADERAFPEMVLGEPEGTDELVFTTLGYGGEITLTFGGAVQNVDGPDLFFVETSFNQPVGCDEYPEFADVFVSLDNEEYFFAGTICKSENTIDISDAGVLDYVNFVKVVNNNTLTKTPDGYDLDGVVAVGTCVDFDIETFLAEQQALLSVNAAEAGSLGFKTYPNPTSGISNIEFVAKKNGKVLIEVYDINGRNVGNVFNQNTFAGQHYKADFNGSSLPAGMYIYKITTNDNVTSEKFVITQ